MATLYFNAAVDNDWNTSGNWWLDALFSTPGYVPSSSDDAIITENCSSNSGSTASVNTLTIQGGSMLGATFSIPCDIAVSCSVISGGQLTGNITGGQVIIDASSASNCTLDDGTGNAGHIIRNGGTATSCIFNGNLAIAQSTDTSNSFIEDTTVNGDVILNSNGQIGSVSGTNTINGNVTINGTGYFATGTLTTNVTNNVIVGSTASSSNTISSVGGDLIYTYGHSATVTTIVTGYTYYSNYPTLYYNNQINDQNWNNRLNWWVDSSHSQQANEVPSSSQDVVINATIFSTTTDMYCNNATINTGLIISNTYASTPLNASGTITVPNTYYIGDSMNPGPAINCSNLIFNGNSYIAGNTPVVASTVVTFNDTSKMGQFTAGPANITAPYVEFYDDSEFINGTITGDAHFYENSIFTNGTVTEDVTVYHPHTAPLTYGGTINGTLSYSGYPARTVYFYHTNMNGQDWGGNFWYTATAGGGSSTYAPDPNISLDNVIIEAHVGTNTGNLDTTVATLTVNDVATPMIFIAIDITCNYANFNDSSFLYAGATLTQSANHGGNSITFSDLSNNQGIINPDTPPVVFEDSASNDGTINGDADVYYPSEKPVGGTVTGFITYYGYTLYFAGLDGDWNNPNNWFLDSANTSPYNDIPSDTMPYHNVILQNNVTASNQPPYPGNIGGTPSAYDLLCSNGLSISAISVDIYGLATFNGSSSYLNYDATINGNALFQDTSFNSGAIVGTATFTLSSAEVMLIDAYGGSYGDIQFQYGKGVNGSSILGLV